MEEQEVEEERVGKEGGVEEYGAVEEEEVPEE